MKRIRPHLVAFSMLAALTAAGCDAEDSSSDPQTAADGGGKQDGFGEDEGADAPAGLAIWFEGPRLYDVVGVSEDDVLNVRAEPTTRTEILAELAPDAVDIEVVAIDATERWAMVNVDGIAGWASLSYLEAKDHAWEGRDLPETLNCGGTEPFWGLSVVGDEVNINTPVGGEIFAIRDVLTPAGYASGAPMRTIIGESERQTATISITPGICSDGASDMLFGLHVNAVTVEDGEAISLGGCCTIEP